MGYSLKLNDNNDSILVEMKNIFKIYPPNIVALRGVNFSVRSGEIIGLLGENGAGKTTLMRILSGVIKPTFGKIYYKGKEVKFSSPHDALKLGIGMVHQTFSLIPHLTVVENILLSMNLDIKSSLKLDIHKFAERVEEFSREVGMPVNPFTTVEQLPAGLKQRVEILKHLFRGVDVLILDEPTSLLSPIEVDALFNFLQKMKKQGKTVILVTHKIHEVKRIADRVVVLAKGKVVGEVYDVKNTGSDVIIKMMFNVQDFNSLTDVTRNITKNPAEDFSLTTPLLEIRDLYVEEDGHTVLQGVDLVLREREILGIAGLINNGQTELAETILGLRNVKRGKILLKGVDITHMPVNERLKYMSFIPDERIYGIVPELPLLVNAVIKDLKHYSKNRIFIDYKKAVEHARRIISELSVVAPSVNFPAGHLSGGNVQRFIVGREILRNPQILIAIQPTMGLDVKTTIEVHKKILELRDRGCGIILISYDLDELLKLSNRVAVIFNGRIVKRYDNVSEIKINELGKLMLTGSIVEEPHIKLKNYQGDFKISSSQGGEYVDN